MRCWLATRGREAATWRELGYAAVFVTLLWPLDLAVALAAVVVPLALITSPLPVALGAHRGLWPGVAISTPLQAAAAVPAGLVLLVGGAYLVTALAVAQGRAGPAAADRPGRTSTSSSRRSPGPAPAWSAPSKPNGGGSNGTCTTARSSGWSRCR